MLACMLRQGLMKTIIAVMSIITSRDHSCCVAESGLEFLVLLPSVFPSSRIRACDVCPALFYLTFSFLINRDCHMNIKITLFRQKTKLNVFCEKT